MDGRGECKVDAPVKAGGTIVGYGRIRLPLLDRTPCLEIVHS